MRGPAVLPSMLLMSLTAGGCATFAHGPRENVQIVTTPPGASVFINGQPAEGTTPTTVSVPRRRAVSVRVERVGYASEEVKLRRRPSRWLWLTLGICANPVGMQGLDSPSQWPLVIVACFASLASVDLLSGAAFAVQKNVTVQLRRAGPVDSLAETTGPSEEDLPAPEALAPANGPPR